MHTNLERLLGPIILNPEEDFYLNKYGFIVEEVDVPLRDFILGILYRLTFWMIFLPGTFFLLLGYVSFFTLGLFTGIIIIPFLIGIYQNYRAISKYFLSKYLYISRQSKNIPITGSYDRVLFGGTDVSSETEKDILVLLGKDIKWFMMPSKKYGNQIISMLFLNSIIIGTGCAILWQMPLLFATLILGIAIVLYMQSQRHLYSFGKSVMRVQILTNMIEGAIKNLKDNYSMY